MGRFIAKLAAVVALFVGLTGPAYAQSPAPSPVALAEKGEGTRNVRRIIEETFPRLKESNYEILKPPTHAYNCIAWAIGTPSEWVWPGNTIEDFDLLTRAFGYQRLETLNYKVEEGVTKIVLYGKIVDGKADATHMARQMPDGTWTSKLGSLALIQHENPDDLDGNAYGRPIAVYVRKAK